VSRDALERLVAAAEGLPQLPDLDGARAEVTGPRGSDRRRLRDVAAPEDLIGPSELRVRVRELLGELARRSDEALPRTLGRAHVAWDQVDSLRILDAAVEVETRALRRAARVMEADDDLVGRALGLEARLTIDAAVDLVGLFERRLATLVRLRLRATAQADDSTPLDSLLPDGKPFLDLGAALHETARRWV
jgi:hypothetical protein